MSVYQQLAEQAMHDTYHRIFVKEEDGGFSAFVLELDGVFGAGETITDANQALEDAMLDWIAFELEQGKRIPPPIQVDSFSGRLSLRIPPSLHYSVAIRASMEKVSVNRVLSDAVAQYVGGTPELVDSNRIAEVAMWLAPMLAPTLLGGGLVTTGESARGWVAMPSAIDQESLKVIRMRPALESTSPFSRGR